MEWSGHLKPIYIVRNCEQKSRDKLKLCTRFVAIVMRVDMSFSLSGRSVGVGEKSGRQSAVYALLPPSLHVPRD